MYYLVALNLLVCLRMIYICFWIFDLHLMRPSLKFLIYNWLVYIYILYLQLASICCLGYVTSDIETIFGTGITMI